MVRALKNKSSVLEEAKSRIRTCKRFILIVEDKEGNTRFFTGRHSNYEVVLAKLTHAVRIIREEIRKKSKVLVDSIPETPETPEPPSAV